MVSRNVFEDEMLASFVCVENILLTLVMDQEKLPGCLESWVGLCCE